MVPTLCKKFGFCGAAVSALAVVDGQPLHICRYAERDGGRLTGVELSEGPLPTDKATVSLLLLLLAQGEVDFVLAGGDPFAGKLELLPVAITLVLAVHEDEGGEARGDVAFRLHVHAERQGEVGDGDEALDVPIAVPCSVLLQPRAAAPELNGAGYLFEGRHIGEGRSRRDATLRDRRMSRQQRRRLQLNDPRDASEEKLAG